MRSITTLTLTLVLGLGLTACPAAEGETDTDTAATNTATMTPMTDGGTTTTGATTAEGTTAEGTTTTPTPTTGDTTTAEPETTTTDGTTGEPGTTTTTDGTTGEPGTTTTTDGTTGGGVAESPYNACASNDDCEMGSFCINSMVTMGAVKGNFCSPACENDMCPDPADGVAAMGGGQCLFGADPMKPTNCAVICVFGSDECGEGSDCEDIGIPPQMGMTFGVCSHPA